MWYDFSKDIEQWDPVIDMETHEGVLIRNSQDKESIKTAKYKELQNWNASNVYTEVEDMGQQFVTGRWSVVYE